MQLYANWIVILQSEYPFVFRAAADGAKIHRALVALSLAWYYFAQLAVIAEQWDLCGGHVGVYQYR